MTKQLSNFIFQQLIIDTIIHETVNLKPFLYVSSTVKCNTGSKRLRKARRDVKLTFSDNEKDENAIQTHLKRRT